MKFLNQSQRTKKLAIDHSNHKLLQNLIISRRKKMRNLSLSRRKKIILQCRHGQATFFGHKKQTAKCEICPTVMGKKIPEICQSVKGRKEYQKIRQSIADRYCKVSQSGVRKNMNLVICYRMETQNLPIDQGNIAKLDNRL